MKSNLRAAWTFLILLSCGSAMVQAAPPRALTKQEQEEAAKQAATFGRDEHARAAQDESVLTEGGENGAGKVRVNGQDIDINKLSPGANKAKADELNTLSETGQNFDELKSRTAAADAEIAADRGTRGKSVRTFEQSSHRAKQADVDLRADDQFWANTLPAIAEGRAGRAGGQSGPQCETTTTVETKPSSGFVDDEYTCERTPVDAGGLLCTREYREQSGTVTYDFNKRALLSVENGSGGLICRRTREVTGNRTTLSQSREGELAITDEQDGLSCRRYRWAEQTVVSETRSKDASLSVNDEADGLSCRRERWVELVTHALSGSRTAMLDMDMQTGGLSCTREIRVQNNTGTQASSMTGVLSVNNEVGGLVCQRWRTVTGGSPEDVNGTASTSFWTANVSTPVIWTYDLSGEVPPGSVITYAAAFMYDEAGSTDAPGECNSVEITVMPSAANGYVATLRGQSYPASNPYNPSCERGGHGGPVSLDWVAERQGALTWSVAQSGNCADVGSTFCPTQWACAATAPTTINGVAVTAAQVAALPVLFPGGTSACTAGTLSRSCAGSASTNNTINITPALPAGTTEISGFGFSVGNPQGGVAVTLNQAPSASNGWQATFTVTRTIWSVAPANPQVTLFWTSNVGTISDTIVETGNCGDVGSVNCPVEWACAANAPVVVNGQTVTASMAAARAPLFPGASASCASGHLNRLCGGRVVTSTNISIADLIPSGVSEISSFDFTIENPQAGVDVTLVSEPSESNGWIGEFRVLKSAFETGMEQPRVTLTWQVNQTTLEWSVRETGATVVYNWGSKDFWAAAQASISSKSGRASAGALAVEASCSDPGSAVCPTSWTCTGSAPTTINSTAVTTTMASALVPLFGGASPTCVSGELRRNCSGAAVVGSTVGIGDQIPSGATSISDLSFTVLNHQPGVAIQMVTPPTFINGWAAGFEVTRTDFGTMPSPVQIRITFRVDDVGVAISTREEGNCGDPGSAQCPTQWNCSSSAPAVVNGNTITLAMVEAEPVLFPSATAACVAGELRRICAGSSVTSTQLPIGDLLPQGTSEITNFQWSPVDAQAQLAILLVSEPSLANGWVATFSVTRDFSIAGAPHPPRVVMTWNVLGPIVYDHSIITEGDCSGGADGAVSQSCEVRWRCLNPLPRNVNGIDLTTAMLQGRQELQLFPGESWDCAEAVRERSCTGDGSQLTIVDISSQIPSGTQAIQNYRWDVLVAGAGVAVEQISAPSMANGWRATFRTTRPDWSIAPTAPEVQLHWQLEVQSTGNILVETGDCSAEGDAVCQAKWRCTHEFPSGDGTPISSGSMQYDFLTPLPGEPHSIAASIASLIPAGTTHVRGFQMQVITETKFSDIRGLVQLPSAANGWIVMIEDAGTCTAPLLCEMGNSNIVVFTWENMGGSGTPPVGAPLYDGAPPLCRRAERYLDCESPGGEVCHETEQGTICEDVEGGPIDTCGPYRDNPACRLDRTVCNEDGWGGTAENPICRLQTDVYLCRRQVEGDDVIIRDTTTCTGEMSVCLDGSCTQNVTQEQVSDSKTMRKASAQLALREAMMTDYVAIPRAGGGGTPPGGGGNPPGGPGNEQTSVPGFDDWLKSKALAAGETLFEGVVGSAQAQSPFDAFKMPTGAPRGIPSDPSQFQQAFGNYTAESMRFFDGNSYNCMKALGGLLNCCTKNVDPKNTNKEWWSSFGDILHSKWSENTQCKINALAPEEKDSGSGFMQQGATPDDLSHGFTGLEDMMKGGGTSPTCNAKQPRMEDVMKDFMGTMRTKYFPKLAWYCDSDEKELAALKETGNCSYLGDYCAKKILGFCIDKRQRHCCFNSPMTKMIREQLRRLGIKGMGTAKRPDCSGVSPQQFAQMNTGDWETDDLEGRMLAGGMFPDMGALFGDTNALLEMFTGTGSAINDDRVNTLDRTNASLDGTDPNGALISIEGILGGQVTTPTTPTGSVAGNVSFTTGYRVLSHGSENSREVRIGLVRDGNAGGVSAQVVAAAGTAVAGTDFSFATQTLYWGANDEREKEVVLRINKAARNDVVTLELQIQNVAGGAAINPTGVMQIEIKP